MPRDSRLRCQRAIPVGADAGHAYGLVHTSSRGERIRPQQAQLYGQMAVQWLTWESHRMGYSIRHQANGREKRIGKLPVDGWCAEIRKAYQFHGCYFHGCPKCHTDPEKINAVNKKTMGELLKNTPSNTAYLKQYVKVVEMWECGWKKKRIETDTKRFIDADLPCRPKWKMTQKQIIAAAVDGSLFGAIVCDIRVPSELRAHFAEMQPIYKNAMMTRDDIGPSMQQYAIDHDIMSTPRRMLVASYRGDKILLITPLLKWYLEHGLVEDHVYQIIEFKRNPCLQHFGESVSAARRAGDTDPSKAIIADTMKLLGNSAYGKTVTNVDRHRDTKYCTSQFINSNRFRQLDVITEDTYEVVLNKSVVVVVVVVVFYSSNKSTKTQADETFHYTILVN